MKKILLAALGFLLAGCTAPREMQVRVTPLGEVVPESVEQALYFLPQTVVRVAVATRETVRVPGPYWEYAEKYLGIREVIRKRSSSWEILDVGITTHTEPDPSMIFQVNLLDGEFSKSCLDPLITRGIILDGTELVREGNRGPSLGPEKVKDPLIYKDLGIDSNFEERTETMYKTLVTDTSFVRVPVDRVITEQKSAAMKAEEAADFILELRTRRFEMLTGDYEGYPVGEAMEATLKKLDELEESYLSLFTGRTLYRVEQRSWFLVPDGGSSPSSYSLGMFSEPLGFAPEELMEGELLEVSIRPLGKTRDVEAYFEGTEQKSDNRLYYRLPDVVELDVELGESVLCRQRLSIFQSGALITSPVEQTP